MDSNDILDDFSPDEDLPKTKWGAVAISVVLFTLLTFVKWKYLLPLVSSLGEINTVLGFSFFGLILLELVLFLLILRRQQYLSRNSMHTLKTAYLHAIIPYGIFSITLSKGIITLFDIFLIIVSLTIIVLPIIVVATMLTNYITDRYMNKKP